MSFLKALAFAALTWWSVTTLTGRSDIGLLAATVPLILGVLGILTGAVYSLAALLFIGAVALRAAPLLDIHLPAEIAQVRADLARLIAPREPAPPGTP